MTEERRKEYEFNIISVSEQVYNLIDEYCINNNITSLKDESQQTFSGCMLYIGSTLFKGKQILKKLPEKTNNPLFYGMINNNGYEPKKVSELCDLYIVLCYKYNKCPTLLAFSLFSSVDQETMIKWRNNCNDKELNSLGNNIYKKIMTLKAETLEGKLVDGKQNPTGIIALMNNTFWLGHGNIEHEERAEISAGELPKLCISVNENS